MTPEIATPLTLPIESDGPPLPAVEPTLLPDTSQLVTDPRDPLPLLDPSLIPDTSLLVVEDGKPVDSIYIEKQQRLLTETLYSSWTSPDGEPFLALANVGLFFVYKQPPLVPDVMLSLNVPPVENMREPDHRSYFSWVVGKMPEIVIEIVSDRRGGEDTEKLRAYARLRIDYYVIYDPDEHLEGGILRAYELQRGKYKRIEPNLFAEISLGLTFWRGEYAGETAQWLRWCDADGQLILTGRELAEQERARADDENRRAEDEKRRAEDEKRRANNEKHRADDEKRRADDEKRRADDEKRRADDEKQRATTAEEKMRQMMERLRALGETVD